MIDKEFLYTMHNIKPYLAAFRFKAKFAKRNCIYLISGDSGVGKTTYLHSLFPEDEVSVFTCAELSDICMSELHNGQNVPAPSKYIVVENIDDNSNSKVALSFIYRKLNKWLMYSGGKLTIACTTRHRDKVRNVKGFNEIKIRPVPINKKTIKKLGKLYGIALSNEDVDKLLHCNNFAKLKQLIQEINSN